MRFQIVYLLNNEPSPRTLDRLLGEDTSFAGSHWRTGEPQLTKPFRLGGVPLHSWFEIQRDKPRPSGEATIIYVFWPKSADDMTKLSAGDIADLEL